MEESLASSIHTLTQKEILSAIALHTQVTSFCHNPQKYSRVTTISLPLPEVLCVKLQHLPDSREGPIHVLDGSLSLEM
jgi:hypothetical protein